MDGLLKDFTTYENFDPASVGRDRQLVLGKHSGGHSVKYAYAQLGIQLREDETPRVLALVRDFASSTKRNPQADDLMQLYLGTILPSSITQ